MYVFILGTWYLYPWCTKHVFGYGCAVYVPVTVVQCCPLLQTERVKKDVTCKDNATKCPVDYTCCVMGKQLYGCCPLPKVCNTKT